LVACYHIKHILATNNFLVVNTTFISIANLVDTTLHLATKGIWLLIILLNIF